MQPIPFPDEDQVLVLRNRTTDTHHDLSVLVEDRGAWRETARMFVTVDGHDDAALGRIVRLAVYP